MQLILVEFSSDRFSAVIFQKICHGISFLYFDDSKDLRGPIWRVNFLKDHLEFVRTYRVTHFESRECDDLYAVHCV